MSASFFFGVSEKCFGSEEKQHLYFTITDISKKQRFSTKQIL